MASTSSMDSPKAGDRVSEPVNEEEYLKYPFASNINVSNFVSVKLLDKSNYTIWRKQMLYLLDSQKLRGFVDPTDYLPPEIKSPNIIRQYERLVEGWIYGTLNERMLEFLVYVEGPRYIWSALEILCDPLQNAPTRLPISDSRISSEELRYMYASNVDDVYTNFVTEGLRTESSYTTWRKQMLCLLDSENLRGFVDGDPPEFESFDIEEKYQSLVHDWIFRSLNETMKRKLEHLVYPGSLWRKLERIHDHKANDFREDVYSEDYFITRLNEALLRKQGQETTTLPSPDIRQLLLKAVAEGRWLEAKLMLKNNKDAATQPITSKRETMLHIAVKEGQNNFLEWLLDFVDDENKMEVRTSNHDRAKTALHYAAVYNNKRAAQLLVKKCKRLLFCEDRSKKTPLQSAYDLKNLDTFLYLWELAVNEEQSTPEVIDEIFRHIDFGILEDAISTKQYDIASTLVNTFPRVAMQDDRLLMAMARTFPSDLSFGEALICPSLKNFHQRIVKRSCSLLNAPRVLYAWAYHVLWATRSLKEAVWLLQETVLIVLVVPVAVLYPLYQLIRLLILVILYPFFMLYFLLWRVLAIAGMPMMRRIEKKRKIYEEAKELVSIACNHIDTLGPFEDEHPCYINPFLEAICQGAYEVVDETLSRSPDLIFCWNREQQDFIQLAITNRSDKIYNLIYHLINFKMDFYRVLEDSSGNNILHLAGRMAPERILNRTTGAALQLQRELQWFQEVEKLMSPRDLVKKNADMETPQMVFTRVHAGLVKEGEQWMKTTSEACSITAALIVTIVFAAAITVPGGNDQEKGIPLFRKEMAFIIFAVCDAISLFSAASALLVFLSILTTRFAEMDFLVSLPRRLIIGLCTLFLSTASMMAAFSAILFLVFCDQRPWMLAPIGGLTCMPIAVIVTLQLPLLVDLFKSTYIPIFGKQKYIDSGKFISKHPTHGY